MEVIVSFHKDLRSQHKITQFCVLAVARACAKLEAILEGKQLHCMVWKQGFHTDMAIMTSLLDMYSKCSCIREARQVFGEMPEKDVVMLNTMISGLCRSHLTNDAIELFHSMSFRDTGSWNSLISGLRQNSEARAGLFFFQKMRVEGVKADVVTMVSVLSLCADLSAICNGKQFHGLAIKYGFGGYLPVGNAIVDMYAKSGCMSDACRCFKCMPSRNVISWTSLITGYGRHGLGSEAVKALEEMVKAGVVPNKITFLGGLYACAHSGLVQEGRNLFKIMRYRYSIAPIMEHYTCMVDLLARSGHLEEAHEFIERMPVIPEARLLTAFFSSCCSHRNIELARTVGKKLLELEPEEAGAYMLLTNFYGLVGDFEGAAKVRRLMLDKDIKKAKAVTWIEINREVHMFESGDRSHPLSKEIYIYLEKLYKKMKARGYVPDTSRVMQDVDWRTKEEILLAHSERLAIAYGLISTPRHSRITIVKNLRICVDCHVATAMISEIEEREIIARDSNRFHHFKEGLCSCGNQW